VRQPHNTTLGVFGRMGLLGLGIWVLFHGIVFKRFVTTIRGSRGTRSETRDLLIWLFIYYVLAFILSTVQPAIEFSHYAIPFYFFIGVALGLMPHERKTQATLAWAPNMEVNLKQAEV
jgi:O-antigen ligase